IFPVGVTTVTCTAVDGSRNTNTCSFTVTVLDKEPPIVACRPAPNPAAKKIPTAGKNPKSGENPDGFYQLLAKDDCDPEPLIFVEDKDTGFLAGPFASGDVVKITQAKRDSSKPGAQDVVAHIQLTTDPVIYAVDSSGNVSASALCFVPPPPK